ncbi:MAG TPA: rhomboid family intramembrane serine protease [Candidatus Saccharimonadia bacterium]|nr:rhomboid family intramembrane serine protease [Candidatus Saccharimonadia bacterium]
MFVNVASRDRSVVPWATGLVLAACTLPAIALAQVPEAARLGVMLRWGTVPNQLFAAGVSSWESFRAARPETLLTAIFVHADWLHLAGNLVFLLIFGLAAERRLGAGRFLALLLTCGAFANLVGATTLGSSGAPIIGASGAVSAIVGAYLTLFPNARLGIVLPLGLFLEFVRMPAAVLITFWAILQVLFSFVGPAFGAIAWWVHIAGFAAGIGFALLSRPGIAKRQRGRG